MFSSAQLSALERKIDAATNDMLAEPDWSSNLDIADTLNETHDASQHVLKAIRRRLAIKTPKVQLLSLTLLETCVKNGPINFHELVSHSDMLKTMVDLGTSNKNNEVREKALQLIQDWAEAFKQQGLNGYHEAYMKLRTKGTPFPRRSEGVVLTPSVNPEIVQKRKNSAAMQAEVDRKRLEELKAEYEDYTTMTPKYIERITNECSQVMDYCGLLRDLIINSANVEEIKGNEAIISLVATLSEVRQRITQLLIELDSEVLLDLCIQMNENVRNAIDFYSARVKGKQEKPPVFITPYSLKLSAQKSAEKATGKAAKDSLSIDFAGLQIRSTTPTPSPSAPSSELPVEEDEWDKIAQRKTSADPSERKGEEDHPFNSTVQHGNQSQQQTQPPPTQRSDSLLKMFDPLA